jgi:hypothetical protein
MLHRYSITSRAVTAAAIIEAPSVFGLMDQLDRGALDDRRKTFH